MVRTLIALFILLTAVASVRADEKALDRQSAELFDSVMSPYCPGRTLSACPSEKARELRDSLRAEIAAGRSVGEIRSRLIKEFADVAGKPEGQIPAAMAYIGVGTFFVIGIGILFITVRTGKRDHVEEES